LVLAAVTAQTVSTRLQDRAAEESDNGALSRRSAELVRDEDGRSGAEG
jgi:cell division protein FtsB